jgi:CBS domain-containing protein
MKVKDVMTTEVATVEPDASLKDVAELLAERRISGVPVVAAEGEVVGVVSEADILFKECGEDGPQGVLAWLIEPGGVAKLDARTAREAMTSPARTIGPEWPVAAAAKRMLEEAVNRFPVVDSGGRLLGIVTRADLVRAFVRPDAAIAREIREDVILKTLWIAPEALVVSVDRGAVRIGGQVESKSDAELIEAFARRVPGTVSVETELTWIEENGRKVR